MQNNQQGTLRAAPGRDLFVPRLLIGIFQGLILHLLTNAAHHRSGIATIPLLLFPLLLVSLFIPSTFIVGLQRMRVARLAMWAAALAAIVAILGSHDAWRSAGVELAGMQPPGRTGVPLPSLAVTFYSGVIVFIGYCLVLAGETARSWFAPYDLYFECSWKLGLQVCLSGLFVCALFLVLWLGAALFLLLKLDFLRQLLRESWFNIPVSTMAFASALHITDVRPDIIRGSRTLVLSLLSWLLLVLVVIVGGFLATLPFTGLGLLWATRSATWILLGVAALKVVFINAAFKSGLESDQAPRVLRVCMRISCLMLPVLVILATYALALRIGQYGLTPHRVLACAGAFVAYFYAIGYTWAAVARSDTLTRIAPVNVVTAWVSLAVLVAVFTPLADPARLSVASQVDRLLAGRVAPDKFDYTFLRYRSARYGMQALARLQGETNGSNAATVRELSKQVANQPTPGPLGVARPDAATLARNIVSRTPGQSVPSSFLSMDWKQATQNWMLPVCLNSVEVKCDAYLVDLTGEHKLQVVLFPNGGSAGFVFDQAGNADWQLVGKFSIAPDCAAVRDALAKGTFELIEPRLRDIQVNGQRVEIEPTRTRSPVCAR
ncbi:DUF4153 domain-containing protein [Paraburkholderia antibiotica]|uniref:DUF4153 domain-containing protein n=1 Tax=Paraburkholderia antibiotica TaxID=2728839 RepID=A0A7Y0A229_9BURK|nr:DUF4153 domain-containing protein [Paraburkholderia antibiotica]NML35082.1 DUF4153 domain-containing protein [Paraburkholderia antibiotica]